MLIGACNLMVVPDARASGYGADNATVLLMAARCHQQLGEPGKALTAAAQVISKSASYGTWSRGQPRMMAVTLGVRPVLWLCAVSVAVCYVVCCDCVL